MKLINFCYIINDYDCEINNSNVLKNDYKYYKGRINYVECLCMSIETLLKFYKQHIEYIYILCDHKNISNDKLTYLNNKINEINIDNKIIIKDINLSIINIKYPENNDNGWKIGKIGLLKFYIPKLINCNEIIYSDADILYNGNILNEIIKDIDNKKHIFKFFSSCEHKYGINSGFIYINCELYNKYNIIDDVIEYYNNEPNIQYVDNSCFQYLYVKYQNNAITYINDNSVQYYINYYLDDHNNLSNKYGVIHFYGSKPNKLEEFINTYNIIVSN